MIEVTFANTVTEAKKYELALDGSISIAIKSKQLRSLIMSAVEFGNRNEKFTLTEMAANAVENHGLKTCQDPKRIGEWHRPALLEAGVIRVAE